MSDTGNTSASTLLPPVLTTSDLNSEALAQHQKQWMLTFLPLAAVLIVFCGTILLYFRIDRDSASRLNIELPTVEPGAANAAFRPGAASSAMKPAASGSSADSAAPKADDTGKKEQQAQSASGSASKVGQATRQTQDTETSANATPAHSAAPTITFPAYPFLNPGNIREPFGLAAALQPPFTFHEDKRPKPFNPKAVSQDAETRKLAPALAEYLWARCSEQTRWTLQQAHDPAEMNKDGVVANVRGFFTMSEQGNNNGAITSPGKLQLALAEAFNAQLSDEEMAIRFQPQQWLKQSRRVVEEQGEPSFHAEQVNNARLMAHRLLTLSKTLLTVPVYNSLQALIPSSASPAPSEANAKATAASALNALLDKKQLREQRLFAPAVSLLPPGLRQPAPNAPAADDDKAKADIRLANRLLLENTFAPCLGKAEPRLSPAKVQKLNRDALNACFSGWVDANPLPPTPPDVLAARQTGHLSWLTYVGLNFGVCLGVIFTALYIIVASLQEAHRRASARCFSGFLTSSEKPAVMQQWAQAIVNATGGPFHILQQRIQADNARYFEKLKEFSKTDMQALAAKEDVDQNSLPGDLIEGLNKLFASHVSPPAAGHTARFIAWWYARAGLDLSRQAQNVKALQASLEKYADARRTAQSVLEELEERSADASRNRRLLGCLTVVGLFIAYIFANIHRDRGTLGMFWSLTIQQELPDVRGILVDFESVAMIAALLLSLAVCVLLIPPTYQDKKQFRERAMKRVGDARQNFFDEIALYYADKVQNTRLLLYIGTVVLATGVLQVSYTCFWAMTYLPLPHDSSLYQQYDLLAKTIVTSRGIYYTMMMAAIYLPANAMLRSLTYTLADEAWRDRIRKPEPQPVASSPVSSVHADKEKGEPAPETGRLTTSQIGKETAASQGQNTTIIKARQSEMSQKPQTTGVGKAGSAPNPASSSLLFSALTTVAAWLLRMVGSKPDSTRTITSPASKSVPDTPTPDKSSSSGTASDFLLQSREEWLKARGAVFQFAGNAASFCRRDPASAYRPCRRNGENAGSRQIANIHLTLARQTQLKPVFA